ncbi:hypothetical protein BKA82DRAFT_32875 [Pisolithus tinctorius]|uniref:Uncharacterized protein n=1 Tax=Pisolithus tinctorius Marx 270 TaxID=870435 RepID=A0A0C3IIN1_PISTI|nr:hypothetical protein BKA82DRAFT_32875 [Pisolithus tinctorius]KIN96827.1 hypothetical protein M404DRAFT_32875 [Pisolithus tinctorius Marx 270]
MPSMIKSISPFYDHDSAAPPPFPTMLTDQLELFGKASHSKSSGLLADKVLPPAHTLSSKKVHVSEVLAQSQKSTLAPKFVVASKTPATWFGSPYPKRAPSQARSESTSTPSTSSDEEEAVSSEYDNLTFPSVSETSLHVAISCYHQSLLTLTKQCGSYHKSSYRIHGNYHFPI